MENNYRIPRNILEGYDIAGLMNKMAKADWYYDYSEDSQVWNKGLLEIKGIKEDLAQLSKMENGVTAANYLWDAYVPDYSVRKPDFLLLDNQQYLSSQNNFTMNEKNLTYLKDNIKYMGFGESLNSDLENQLKKGGPEFTLALKTEVNQKSLEATLHFKRSDTTDMYFFNKYDVRASVERKDETLSQTFYLNKGTGVTLKEAYNLLNGRAVHKELTDKNDQKYQAWVQLDFGSKDKNGNFERKQYHQNYGYDIKEALSYYPIKEMLKEDDKEKLIRSLEKGNLQSVTMQTLGKEVKIFIEANPQYKTLNLYNGKMQNMSQEQRQELMIKPELKEQNKDMKIDKEALVKEDQPGKKQGKGAKKTNSDESTLLPKKRNSNKKGLSV